MFIDLKDRVFADLGKIIMFSVADEFSKGHQTWRWKNN